MKISIIIPIYNREKVISRAVESVLKTKKSSLDVEIILVDDGSEDNSKKIMLEYSKKYNNIFSYFLDKNYGVNYARNYGILKSSGDFILFLDSDDSIYKETLICFEKILKKFPNQNLFFFQTQLYPSKKILSNVEKEGIFSYKDYLSDKIKGEFLPIFSKKILNKVTIDTSRYAFESIFWTQVIREFSVVISKKVLRKYYIDYDNRISKDLFSIKNAQRRFNDYVHYLNLFGEDILKFKLNRKYAKLLKTIGVFGMLTYQKNSKEYFLKAYKMDKSFISLLLYLCSHLGSFPFRIILFIKKLNA
jgi:glycosyltransferase involved in cell wall biosynthesis